MNRIFCCTNNWQPLQVGKSYSSAREALFLNGSFVVEYLKAVDAKSGGELGLAETPVASAILEEVSALVPAGIAWLYLLSIIIVTP